MADDDQIRFGDVSGGGDGTGLDAVIDAVIQLIVLVIVLFMFYKVIMALLPLL